METIPACKRKKGVAVILRDGFHRVFETYGLLPNMFYKVTLELVYATSDSGRQHLHKRAGSERCPTSVIVIRLHFWANVK